MSNKRKTQQIVGSKRSIYNGTQNNFQANSNATINEKYEYKLQKILMDTGLKSEEIIYILENIDNITEQLYNTCNAENDKISEMKAQLNALSTKINQKKIKYYSG